jgi:hypothetical protein
MARPCGVAPVVAPSLLWDRSGFHFVYAPHRLVGGAVANTRRRPSVGAGIGDYGVNIGKIQGRILVGNLFR